MGVYPQAGMVLGLYLERMGSLGEVAVSGLRTGLRGVCFWFAKGVQTDWLKS